MEWFVNLIYTPVRISGVTFRFRSVTKLNDARDALEEQPASCGKHP